MKYIYYSLVVAFSLLVYSCDECDKGIDTSFQVGNILCSDGSVLHPTLYQNSGKKAIGVVFWANDGKSEEYNNLGFAVSLNDVGSLAVMDTLINIDEVSSDVLAFNGAENTAAYMSFVLNNNIPSPAVEACVNYLPENVSGWYLPCALECTAMNANLAKINLSLTMIDGDNLSGWYWTSTKDGTSDKNAEIYMLVSSISEGRFTSSLKHLTFKVRPVIEIK